MSVNVYYSARRTCLLAAGLALISACGSESLSAPERQVIAPDAVSASRMAPPVIIRPRVLLQATGVLRTTPLTSNISVSAVIGTAGGRIVMPSAGLTLVFPAGALAQPTTITVTARKGALVAYDFLPHGITFAKPITFSQALRGTGANPLAAFTLGYYADPAQLTATGATISESNAGSVAWGNFNSTISHFSGYMVASGSRPVTVEGEF